ncbi:TIGR01777 family protein [Neobacillus notoginsengisoli]|uniref:TIGR01777 family protein n=1 Tax=Neobacillus notoginsengisoli TaxID=1578198 RepID=A0A417YJT1_9BACI|nr:TIGR01777 family oxidoreductase [Neobacillus notoginsengisoli]RHW33351.1 TIGR01777 family protein [Neobacillus notoginsengisoli]
MRIAIAGGSGFLGNALTDFFLEAGHDVFILTRRKKKSVRNGVTYIQWLEDGSEPERELEGIDAFINLAGESLNSGRWTEERKERLLMSRLVAAEEAVRIMKSMSVKPAVHIAASAVGFYGTSNEKTFTEENEHGSDFLASLVRMWEEVSAKTEAMGIRTVFCRFGIILDQTEGALPRMALPYKLFAGGTVGSGRQWVSWIHKEDAVGGVAFAIENSGLNGPINFTAPNPAKMNEFGLAIGKALGRPHWLPVPGVALKLLLGEMSVLVLKGQRVVPAKLLQAGYRFRHPELSAALENIFKN